MKIEITREEIRRRSRCFSIERRTDYYIASTYDGSLVEEDFKTRAEARQWLKEHVTRTGRFWRNTQ